MIRLRLETRVGAEMNALFALDNLRHAMAQTYYIKDENDEDMLYNNRRRLVDRIGDAMITKGDIGEYDQVLEIMISRGEGVGNLVIHNKKSNWIREEEFILMNKEQHRVFVDEMLKEMEGGFCITPNNKL